MVRKAYTWLMDTNFISACNWFLHGQYKGGTRTMVLEWPATDNCDAALTVELLFRAAETGDDEQKFRSTEVTGAWIDESIQLLRVIKQTIISRLGRFPKRKDSPCGYVPTYLIETTNPCGAEDEMYWQYRWVGPKVIKEPERNPDGSPKWETGVYDTGTLVPKAPPGPVPSRPPVPGFVGFWQEMAENAQNIREGYWDDIRRMYPEAPEMTQMLVEGKPGYRPEGKPVYRNYRREFHMAQTPLEWKRVADPFSGEMKGVPLIRGWDNSGDVPAAILIQQVGPLSFHVLREWYDDRMGIVDFTEMVKYDCGIYYADAKWTDYCDPAGFAKMSSPTGGLTSNAQIQREVCHLDMKPSRQELDLRISAVDSLLGRMGGLLIDPRCTRLLNGFFGGYVREENIRMGVNEFKSLPKKNKFSHIHDALQYALTPLVYPEMKSERDDIKSEVEAEREAYSWRWGTSKGSMGWVSDQPVRTVVSGQERGDRANDGGGDWRKW